VKFAVGKWLEISYIVFN